MEHDHLIAMLNRLKLTAIRDQLDSLIDEAGRRELTIREALSLFCEREIARKDERRIEMGVGLARFPFVRDLDSFDFAAQPSIEKRQIREIAAGRFIATAAPCGLIADPFSLAPCSLGQEPALAKAGDAARRLRRCRRIRGGILDCRCARCSSSRQVGTKGWSYRRLERLSHSIPVAASMPVKLQ